MTAAAKTGAARRVAGLVLVVAACGGLSGCQASLERRVAASIDERAENLRNRLEYMLSQSAASPLEERIRDGELSGVVALDGEEPAVDLAVGLPTEVVYEVKTDAGDLRVSFLEAAQATGDVGLIPDSRTVGRLACMAFVVSAEGGVRGETATCPPYVETLYSAYEPITRRP